MNREEKQQIAFLKYILHHKNIYILDLLNKRNINFKQSFGELSLNLCKCFGEILIWRLVLVERMCFLSDKFVGANLS